MLTPVRIEAMRVEDISHVTQIERESFATPWPRDAYYHELRENRLATYLVARLERAIVGYAGMWVILDEAHITTIAVGRAHRGEKVGERLLVALIEAALDRGARWITLEVRRSNSVAQALYHKYGFKEIGVRKGYYSDNREDAVVMWTGNVRDEPWRSQFDALRARLHSD